MFAWLRFSGLEAWGGEPWWEGCLEIIFDYFSDAMSMHGPPQNLPLWKLLFLDIKAELWYSDTVNICMLPWHKYRLHNVIIMMMILQWYHIAFLFSTPRFTIQNLNKQSRLYQQGLSPMIKTYPGRGTWERLRDRVEHEVSLSVPSSDYLECSFMCRTQVVRHILPNYLTSAVSDWGVHISCWVNL